MVHLDVAETQLAVRAGEIEGADVTLQREPSTLYVLDLPGAESGVPLANQRPADEETTLYGRCSRFVDLVGLRRYEVQFARADAFREDFGCLAHLSFTLGESLDHEQGWACRSVWPYRCTHCGWS
ncbi:MULTISPECIES: hypothetical protein [Streptomyces]|uniref:Uncharacterized protein n=1 Tax=Streptomyces edwardsiae TaxID=3075527 RepID=A0ABU2Q2C9_9ACTN|nr:hypothetical protein [Streptomyces sp. DSM 41636]MDT0397409.1 hypothetical protein [Streptomyces sp. DSM 41636]